MRHRGVERFMSMTMKPHKADPEMPGGVTVYGMWRKFAADCSFAPNKLIRFKFMYFNVDVSGGDHLQDSVYPVFHLC